MRVSSPTLLSLSLTLTLTLALTLTLTPTPALATPPLEACEVALGSTLSLSSPKSLLMLLGASGVSLLPNMGNEGVCHALADSHLCVLSGQLFLPSLSLSLPARNGLCLPTACTSSLLSQALAPSNSSALPLSFVGSIHCVDEAPKRWDTLWDDSGAVAAVATLATLVFLVALASLLDAYLARDKDPDVFTPPQLGYPDPAHTLGGFGGLGSDRSLLSPGLLGTVGTATQHLPTVLGGDLGLDRPLLGLSHLGYGSSSSSSPGVAFRKSTLGKTLLSFSAVHNLDRLMVVPPPLLNVTNGIRVLSMFLIIIGHTVLFSVLLASAFDPTAPFGSRVLEASGVAPSELNQFNGAVFKFPFQIILGAEFCVDTFFFLSGLFLVFLTLRKLATKPDSLPASSPAASFSIWPLAILHRYLRLTPALGFMLFVHIKLVPYLGRGPLWHEVAESISETCNKNNHWLANIGYINNFVPAVYDDQCAGWTWYLANDFQFVVLLGPFLVAAFRISTKAGLALTSFLVAACMGIGFAIGYHNDLSLFLTPKPGTGDQSTEFYGKPYTRMGAWVIGAGLGGVLDYFGRTGNGRLPRIPLAVRAAVYVAAGTMMGLTFFGQYSNYKNQDDAYGSWNKGTNVSYLAFSRPAWTLALASLVFVWMSSVGPSLKNSLVSSFLSAPLWAPLARLTYSAYLWHPVLMYVIYGGRDRLGDYSVAYFAVHSAFFIFAAYALAVVSFILVEKPLMNLEALFLPRL